MASSDPLEKHPNDSDSDSHSEDEADIDDPVPKVIDVDVTKLTPLSPQVISKQVSRCVWYNPFSPQHTDHIHTFTQATINLGTSFS